MCLTLLRTERPKLLTILAFLSAIGLKNGTPKIINFPCVPKGKLMIKGVPIFEHMRVCPRLVQDGVLGLVH